MYRVPVIEAIRVTGATYKVAGLYQRLSRHRAREVAAEELAITEYDRKNDPDNNNMAIALKAPLAVLPSKAIMLEAAIDVLPEWCDPDITRKFKSRLARKNLTQAHLSRLTGQVEKRYYDGRYCARYKAATLAVQSAAGAGGKKYGTGLRAAVNRINKEMLNSPHDKKLTKSTIYNAIARGGL